MAPLLPLVLFLVLPLGLTAAVPPPAVAQEAAPRADIERARALFLEAEQAYAEGRFAEAAATLLEAYELTQSPALAFNLARTYERMSEYDSALRYLRIYQRGALSDEERADAEARVARIEEAKRRQRAQVFTEVPAQDALTAEARVFFERGVQMFRRRHYEAALSAFTAAHRFAALPEVLYNLAVTAERLEQRRDAADYYREYLRLRPEAADRGAVEAKIAQLLRR